MVIIIFIGLFRIRGVAMDFIHKSLRLQFTSMCMLLLKGYRAGQAHSSGIYYIYLFIDYTMEEL